jgi:hypothetical protein
MRKYVGILKEGMDLYPSKRFLIEAQNINEANMIARLEADKVSNYGEGPVFITSAYAIAMAEARRYGYDRGIKKEV